MGTSCSATRPNNLNGLNGLSHFKATLPLEVAQLAGTIDVVSAFLAKEHASAREAVRHFVEIGASAIGGQVHVYNCQLSRGRQAVVSGRYNYEDDGFFLVTSSSPGLQPGEPARPSYVALLQDALDKGVAYAGPTLAAAAVRSRGGVDGILLVEMPSDLLTGSATLKAGGFNGTATPAVSSRETKVHSQNGEHSAFWCEHAQLPEPPLACAARLWSQILGERLEKLHHRQTSQDLTKALNSILGTMEKVIDAGIGGTECHAAMSHTSNMIPSEVLRGGIESDRAALWFYDDYQKEVVLNNSGHLDGIRVPVDQSIVGDAVRFGTGRVICVPDVNQDSRFNRSVDQRTGFCTQSTICVPILMPRSSLERRKTFRRSAESAAGVELQKIPSIEEQPTMSVVQLTKSRRPGETGQPIDHFDIVFAENIQHSVLPMMLMVRDFFMEFLEMERQKEGLQAVVSLVSKADSVTEVIALVEQEVNDVMSCECCTFFFIDEANNEVWAPPTSSRPNGICVSIGEGLVGHMAELAQTDAEQCARMMTTNDPQTHPFWKGDVRTDFVTRNLMTTPVWSAGKDKRLMGLIQILNKRTTSVARGRNRTSASPCGSSDSAKKSPDRGGRMSAGYDSPSHEKQSGFTPADERCLQSLAAGVGSHLDRLLVDMIWTKAEMDTSNLGKERGPGSAMMSEYYSIATKVKTVIKSGYPEIRRSRGDDINGTRERFWSTRTMTSLGPSKDPGLFSEQKPPDDGDVLQWRVDYWNLSEFDEFRLFLQALRDTGCISEKSSLDVEDYALHNFFLSLRAGYRAVPFHNFRHALSTMHFAYKLMTESECIKVLNYESQYAIIVAALCHDCDHRGYNNAFEIMTRSELALRYNDNAPLENHHCARAFEIALGNSTKAGNCNIFSGLNRESFVNVRQQIIAGILATDMKHHGDHVNLIQQFHFKNSQDNEQSQFLVELFLHAADISNPFMPPDISRRWATLVAEEFTMQVTKERELGLPVTAFMDGLSDPIKAAKSQIGFVDFVIHPLTDPFFRLFPGLADCSKYLDDNKAENVAIVEKDKAANGA